MVDCHMHMVLDGVDWRGAIARHAQGPDIPYIRRVLEAYRTEGFTYLRDGGDRWGVGAAARELSAEYGITYRTPLSPLHLKGHYGGFIGTGFESEKDYVNLVKGLRRDGADFLKLMISGLMDFSRPGVLTEPGMDPKLIRELIHIGKEEGFAVMIHGNGGDTVLAAAEAGADSIEHGAYLHTEALAAMAERGTVWVPTLSTVGNLIGKGRFPDRATEEILEGALENVAAFHALGGLIAPGSDAGAWAVPHGIRSEYTWLQKALGSRTTEALAQGTRAIRDKF